MDGHRGVCFATEIAGLPITLTQQGIDKFTVTYWKQVKRDLDYSQAALELGASIMHAATLSDQLDNRERRGGRCHVAAYQAPDQASRDR